MPASGNCQVATQCAAQLQGFGTPPAGDKAIVFTRDYLQRFEKALAAHKDSAGVISTLKKQYPGLADESSLELSAKVNTGEMKW